MDVTINEQNGKLTISLGGSFSFADVSEFNQVVSAMDRSGLTSCEFNLSDLKFIDSSGLGNLVSAHDVSVRHGYPVAIKGAQGSVLKVFKVTKMDNLFEIT